jgi:hypothetical protein
VVIAMLVAANGFALNNRSAVYLSQNVISHNDTFGAIRGGTLSAIYTFGNNRFTENASIGSTPFTPIAFE